MFTVLTQAFVARSLNFQNPLFRFIFQRAHFRALRGNGRLPVRSPTSEQRVRTVVDKREGLPKAGLNHLPLAMSPAESGDFEAGSGTKSRGLRS